MASHSRKLIRQALVLALAISVAQCGDHSQAPTDMTFVTPSGLVTTTPPEIFVGAGDISECDGTGDSQTAALLDNIPGRVFTLGDNVYPTGSASDFANCYEPTWGRHKHRTHPVAGNKEYDTSGAAGYFGYFGSAAGTAGQGYYSFDLGAWHIIVLNSNIARTAGSPQDLWLQADLQQHPNQCTMALFHHPLYSSTSGTTSNTYGSVRRFWDVLYAAGVDVILSAHRHVYERLAPMRPDGTPDPQFGIRSFVVGTGGESGGEQTNVFPTSERREGGTLGVMKLYLYEDSYAWKFVPVAGRTFSDSGSVVCHRAPGSSAVSAEQSSATAAPASIPASAGASTSTITVTARDASGDPVSGVNVVLSATGTGNTIVQPAGPTGSNGVATGTLSSTAAGPKTITAVADGVPISDRPIVTVTAGAPSADQSGVAASPATIVVGSGVSTVTVTARDAWNNPVSGATVALSATGTGNTITQPTAPTDASGVATGALRSSDPGAKTVTAAVNGTTITQSATVTVVTDEPATISQTLLTAGNDITNQKVFTTAPISPAPDALVTVAVLGHRSTNATSPTLSGGGMGTWTQVASVDFDVLSLPLKRLTIFRAMSSAPGSGPITITFAQTVSNAQWIVSQWEGVETGSNGAAAIGQVVSTRADESNGLSASVGPLGSPRNVLFGAFGVNSQTPAITPGSGFSEIAERASGESTRASLQTEWAADRTTVDATWSGLRGGAIGVELKARSAP
jgi:Bacterial Ig-like domain (group 1)/Invasin, domain 3/Calcineurin-like phosphoesterase